VIDAFELLIGARTDREKSNVETLLAAALHVMPVDAAASALGAEARRSLEQKGMGIGLADYLIAGVCLSRSATLLTRNRAHFERVPGLRIGMSIPGQGSVGQGPSERDAESEAVRRQGHFDEAASVARLAPAPPDDARRARLPGPGSSGAARTETWGGADRKACLWEGSGGQTLTTRVGQARVPPGLRDQPGSQA
jgi:hypothetical protein